jgi:hypothetical protein
MISLHNHLQAFLDLGQYGIGITSEFGFANVECSRITMILR